MTPNHWAEIQVRLDGYLSAEDAADKYEALVDLEAWCAVDIKALVEEVVRLREEVDFQRKNSTIWQRSVDLAKDAKLDEEEEREANERLYVAAEKYRIAREGE